MRYFNFRSVSEYVGTASFINRIFGLFALVFTMVIGAVVLPAPHVAVVVLTVLWFLLVGLMVWSSMSWASHHLNPKN